MMMPIFRTSVDKDALLKAGNNDAGNFYEMCIEFLGTNRIIGCTNKRIDRRVNFNL